MRVSAPEKNEINEHVKLIVSSFRSVLGRDILPNLPEPQGQHGQQELAEHLFNSEPVILTHGTQPDPIFKYGNRNALALFELSWDELVRMPSRLSAEPVERSERLRMLGAVNARGYIDDYKGVRVSSSGKRFWIDRAIIWNLMDAGGVCRGQAAIFDSWDFL